MQYLMLTTAAALLGIDFALNKIYQRIYGTTPKASFFFNSLLGLLTAVVFFVIGGCSFDISLFSFLLAAMMAILSMSYSIIGFRLLKSGTMATYTLFLMTGGMLLPYVFGILFLEESVTVLRVFAVLFVLAGVVLSNFSGEKIQLKQLGMCIAVFVLNGFTSIVSKVHQIPSDFASVSAAQFVALSGLFKFFVAGILFLIFRKKQSGEQLPEPDGNAESGAAKRGLSKAILLAVISSVVGGVSYLLQLVGAESVPATVLYPFISGGSIVFSSIVGVVVFREKLSVKMIVSLVLCVVGTLMFL